MKYDLIYLDPPWKYDDPKGNDPAMGGIIYPTLSIDEMAAIPIGELANKDAIMLMWITAPKMEEALYLMRCYKFRPVTCMLTWVKLNRTGQTKLEGRDIILSNGIYSGLGHYVNGNAEFLWIGRRGKGLPRINKNVKQIMFEPLGKHSQKPEETYNRINSLFGTDINRIELFARPPVPEGWIATGLDYDGKDIREFIRCRELIQTTSLGERSNGLPLAHSRIEINGDGITNAGAYVEIECL